jgi:hypothetical protein
MDFYLNLVNKLEFADEPNYFQLQTKIKQTLQSCGYAMDDSFNLLASNVNQKQEAMGFDDDFDQNYHFVKATKGAKRKQKETIPVSSPSTPTSRKKPKSKPTECPVVNGHDKSDDDDIVEIIDSKCNRIRSQVLFTTSFLNTCVICAISSKKAENQCIHREFALECGQNDFQKSRTGFGQRIAKITENAD